MKKLCSLCLLFPLAFASLSCYHPSEKESLPHTSPSEGEPIVLETYDGYGYQGAMLVQEFDKSPERIVAVSEATIDNLLLLGLQDKIVGISHLYFSVHPPYDEIYERLPKLTEGPVYPSREAILLAAPDIIIGWGSLFNTDALGSVQEWHKKGVHTYVMKNTVPTRAIGKRKVEYFLEDLRNLSRIFRIQTYADPLIEGLSQRIDTVKERAAQIPEDQKPTILTLQYINDNEYFARNATDMTTDIIELAGGRSLDGKYGGNQSLENLIQSNPDIILIVNMPESPATKKIDLLRHNPALRHVKAIQNDNFAEIDHMAFYCGSTRTLDAIEQLHAKVMEYCSED